MRVNAIGAALISSLICVLLTFVLTGFFNGNSHPLFLLIQFSAIAAPYAILLCGTACSAAPDRRVAVAATIALFLPIPASVLYVAFSSPDAQGGMILLAAWALQCLLSVFGALYTAAAHDAIHQRRHAEDSSRPLPDGMGPAYRSDSR